MSEPVDIAVDLGAVTGWEIAAAEMFTAETWRRGESVHSEIFHEECIFAVVRSAVERIDHNLAHALSDLFAGPSLLRHSCEVRLVHFDPDRKVANVAQFFWKRGAEGARQKSTDKSHRSRNERAEQERKVATHWLNKHGSGYAQSESNEEQQEFQSAAALQRKGNRSQVMDDLLRQLPAARHRYQVFQLCSGTDFLSREAAVLLKALPQNMKGALGQASNGR
ncbi:MAG TPA: hypothetical protein VK327_07890, partial [Candidatus Paceibacterota bacterium]|nr:hypothetical protein [Candidatus Paceibacterota bacterium]